MKYISHIKCRWEAK